MQEEGLESAVWVLVAAGWTKGEGVRFRREVAEVRRREERPRLREVAAGGHRREGPECWKGQRLEEIGRAHV